MSAAKQSRRKTGAKKLEPIDWHEFANDAVLNGNMSTLYHRPPSEDATAYASPEALVEIGKRVGRPAQTAVVVDVPTVGNEPTVGMMPTVGQVPGAESSAAPVVPTMGAGPTVGIEPTDRATVPTVGARPAVGSKPTVGKKPTVGVIAKKRVKPIRDVQDALTLAGQVLYKAMYGAPDGARSKSCTKGYRQLAAETHLDKDTVRDLISEFKDKGMVRETGAYDPDTRSSKTYEVLSYKAILQIWRDSGVVYVTTGRQRPAFCTAQGEPVAFIPTVGTEPTVAKKRLAPIDRPTVGMTPTEPDLLPAAELIQALQQITGSPVDQEAADRLIRNCRTEAADCTIEEIVEFAWSKAFLCRSGKIENPTGFLITQVPKHFQPEALKAYRETKRKELEAAARLAAGDEERRRQSEREMAEIEERQRSRSRIAERHRMGQGIDLKSLLQDPEADEALKEWARRMLKLGHRYQPQYE